MPVRLESDLRGPLMTWLEDAGFDVRVEVPILNRRADLVGSRDSTLTAVEMKLHQWPDALRQAVAYQLAADHAWIAMPLAAASRAYRQRWILESEGVGLLAVDDRGWVRIPIPARPSPRLLPFLKQRVIDTCTSAGPLRLDEGPPPSILSRFPPATSLVVPRPPEASMRVTRISGTSLP